MGLAGSKRGRKTLRYFGCGSKSSVFGGEGSADGGQDIFCVYV